MSRITIVVDIADEWAGVLRDPEAEVAQEIADMLIHGEAILVSYEWQRAAPVRVIGEPGEALEECAVGAV